MKNSLTFLFFLFFSFSAYAIVTPTLTPSPVNVERIAVAAVMKNTDGAFLINYKTEAFSEKVVEYLVLGLKNSPTIVEVVREKYFPEDCRFVGTFIERYNPSPRPEKENILFLFYTLEEGKDYETTDALELCQATLRLPEEWPEKNKMEEHFAFCRVENNEDFFEREFCKAKYKLDGIIWSLNNN